MIYDIQFSGSAVPVKDRFAQWKVVLYNYGDKEGANK